MGTVPSCHPSNARPPGSSSNSSKISHPRPLPSHQHFIPVGPLAATLMDSPASVANKRLTARLNPLAATLTKNRGVGPTFRRFDIRTFRRSDAMFASRTQLRDDSHVSHLHVSSILSRRSLFNPAHYNKKLPHPLIPFSYNPPGRG